MASPTYAAIADAEIDTDSPITGSLMTRMRNNPESICEGEATALAAGKGIAIDYDFGTGSQTAPITDETDDTKYLRADGSGQVEFWHPRIGGGQQGVVKDPLSNTWRPNVAETLENMTQVQPSDGWGFGLRCDVTDGMPRATLIGTCEFYNAFSEWYIIEDDGVALTVKRQRTANPSLFAGIMVSIPLVYNYVYIFEIRGAATSNPDDMYFSITN